MPCFRGRISASTRCRMQIGTEPHARRARSCKVACIRNRYYRRARLGERKFREVARCLALDMSVSDTSRLTGVSIRSVNTIFLKIRLRMAQEIERYSIFNFLPDNTRCAFPAAMSAGDSPRSNGSSPPLLRYSPQQRQRPHRTGAGLPVTNAAQHCQRSSETRQCLPAERLDQSLPWPGGCSPWTVFPSAVA